MSARYANLYGLALGSTGHVPFESFQSFSLDGLALAGNPNMVLPDEKLLDDFSGLALASTGRVPLFNEGDTFESLLRYYLYQTLDYRKLVPFDMLELGGVSEIEEGSLGGYQGINTTITLHPKRGHVLGGSYKIFYRRYPIMSANIKGARFDDIESYLGQAIPLHQALTDVLGVEIREADFTGYIADNETREFSITINVGSRLWQPGTTLTLD